MAELSFKMRVGLFTQRLAGRLVAVLWIPLAAFVMRYVMRYRVHEAGELRRRFRELVSRERRPVLLCANHLTMIDSFILAWALGGSWWYVFNYQRVPWNLPERSNFASNWLSRVAAWLAKCIPVVRGGSREHVANVMRRVRHLLVKGEPVLVFPEGGRSRTGRVEPGSAAYGVGRILNAVPGCRTILVYLRGEGQKTWSAAPARGETFYADFKLFEPTSEHTGLRGARDLSHQIVDELVAMESEYFADR